MSPATEPEHWRCFVAVPLGESLRGDLAVAVEALRAEWPDADAAFRWAQPQGWHVTLAFLGATDPESVPGIVAAVDGLAAESGSFRLATGGCGAFPSRRAARVLWYGIHDPERRLRELAVGLRSALETDQATPFRAHVTMARSRHRHGTPAAPLLAAAQMPSGELVVDRLVLYRSHRGKGPAQYEALHESRLGSGVPAGGVA
jgi:2'-5' RNA ligase